MVANATRLQIRDRIRRRVNASNSTFWTDAQLDTEIDASAAEWYEIVIAAYGEGYLEKYQDFTTTADTESYAETTYTATNNDFLIARAVGFKRSDDDWFRLPRFSGPNEYFSMRSTTAAGRPEQTHWDIIGDNLYLLPVMGVGETIRLWYIPTYTKFANDSANLNGRNGWEEYVVLDVCSKYRESENKSAAVFDRRRDRIEERIRTIANKRKAGNPSRIITRRRRGLRARHTL
jgi:hypothetical protein